MYNDFVGVFVDSTSRTLRDQYISSRFSVVGDDWPPHQPKHYTSLAVIHHKEKYISKKVNNGDSQTRQHSNTMKNISELFATAEHSANILLIEGAPGIGKTILCKEIAYQWANNNLLQYKKLLFLVYLRNLHSSKLNSVEMFVQHVLKSKEAAAGLGKYFNENDGKDLVVVLDGYDELSEADRKNSFIADLIRRRVLWNCLLVITSRPSALLPLHDIADCRVEVAGFTEENRLDYINSALAASPEKVAALQGYLQANSTINALCYIPLNMTILLCLSENGISQLPKTQTEMYGKVIEMTIIRLLGKMGENISDAAVFNLNSLPHPHDVVFKELSRFAYEALKCDKVVFKLTEIQEICPSLTAVPTNWNGLGLLNSVTYVEDGSKIVTYHFLHFSIQEYMAAYHISTLPERKQLKLLRNTFWSADYYNTWIMYVGITGGDTFPLKHFLSGNYFQISTGLFKTGISKTLLHNKIKCLHIFQCLVEAQSSDLLSLFGEFFKNQEINLSDQTLLPRDLNTLRVFLIRSINKHWKKLDLSGCNIGSAGLKILFERFVDKDTLSVVTIDRVDLSYNQLNFSFLVGLLNLVKTWKTSELISVDDFVFDNETACNIFEAVEHVILQSSDVVILKTLLIGSFLFAYKLNENEMLELLSKAKHIKTMYLISCRWELNPSETTSFLIKQNLSNVHILGSCLNSKFLTAVSSTMSQCNDNFSLVIDDPTLYDQIAYEIIGILPNSISNGIILVVSNSKIQGVINTCSLSSELSNLEMLNLIRRMRTLYSSCVPPIISWDEKLQWHGNKGEGIIESFVDVLLSYKNASKFQLKIGLVEKHTLIAHALKCEEICESLSKSLTSIYLNNCDIRSNTWNNIVANFSNISSPCLYYILNCQIELYSILSLNRFMLRELFVHSTGNITSDDVEAILSMCHHTSVVVITKDTLGAHNPTSKQLAMAHKLEPSVTNWKFFDCNLNTDTCKQIAILLTSSKVLNELKFVGCCIGTIDIEMLTNHLIAEKHVLTIQNLHISSSRLASSITSALAEIVSISNVIIDDSKYLFFDGEIKILQIVSTLCELHIRLNNVTEEMVNDIAAVILNNKSLRTLDLGRNNIQAAGMAKIAKALQNVSFLFELLINNNDITEEAADDIVAVILNNTRLRILNLGGNKFQTAGMIKIAKALQNVSSLTGLYINKNNITEEAADDIAAVILNNGKLQILNISGNEFQSASMIKIAKALQNISSLSELYINKNNITKEAADDIAPVILNNNKLQILNISGNKFHTAGMIRIAKALQNIYSLSELYINENNITEEAADDIAAVILNNSKLQILNISGNEFQSAGMIKIAKALQNISSLSELYINKNNITKEAADDIAPVILNNNKLQILNISGNKFHTAGMIRIAKALQNIYSLSELYINENNITEEVADDIAAVILNNSKLRILNISGNKFQTAGMIKIAKALQNISSLNGLHINHNNITEEAADDIAAVILNNGTLQTLNISGNAFHTAGMIKIAKALQNIYSLSELYINENNITKEAADDITAVILNSSNLQILNISGNAFHTAGMIKIAKALQNITSLSELYINKNNITTEAADDIAAVILNNSKLQVLNISGNKFQTAGMIKIAKALQNISSLNGLHIIYSNITKEAADDIAAVILNNSKLQILNISGNTFHTAGMIKIAKALQNISSLSELYINENNITEEAADDIADVILNNSKLQILNISGNAFHTDGMIKIAKALQNISSLSELYINENNITEEAADDIAAVIVNNSTLQILNISGNAFHTAGIIKIAKALQNISSLSELYINENNITKEAADDIAAVILNNSKLQMLNISGNAFHTAGIIKIAKALQNISSLIEMYINGNNITEEAADDIAAVILNNNKLKTLSISINNFQTAGMIKIAKALRNISSLSELKISENNITEEAADDIAAIVQHNSNLFLLDISNNMLQATGAIKIAQAVQNVPSFRILFVENNQISKEARDKIATILSCKDILYFMD